MALNFEANTSSAKSNGKTGEDKPKTQIWLNVGYEGPDGKFVNLPIGIPIDTMAALPIRGSNEDWNKFQSARNKMLEKFQKYGSSMEAGAEEIVNGLVVKIKRVSADAEVNDRENEYLDNGISFGE